MPYDGSGNFNRALGPDTWQNDAAAGIKIKSDLHDNNDNDIAGGLSNVICKDGQSSPTADITLNGHKLINVANPSSPQDAMTLNAFAAAAVRYDAAQALTLPQRIIAHTNIADLSSVLVKSAAYSLLPADRSKYLFITGTCTITLPLAADVGNDFSIDWRTAGGVLTLAPTGGAQIVDGTSGPGAGISVVIPDGASGKLWCDGVNWQIMWAVGDGSVVDSVTGTYVASLAISPAIPLDTSIPQITEGTQIIAVVITPKSTTNKLRCRFAGTAALNYSGHACAAMFHNTNANAVRATYSTPAQINFEIPLVMDQTISPGAITPQTVSVRVGHGTVGAGALYMNGSAVITPFGGTAGAVLTVEEIKG